MVILFTFKQACGIGKNPFRLCEEMCIWVACFCSFVHITMVALFSRLYDVMDFDTGVANSKGDQFLLNQWSTRHQINAGIDIFW